MSRQSIPQMSVCQKLTSVKGRVVLIGNYCRYSFQEIGYISIQHPYG
ncbi:hypothetical protein MATR_19620 [Marivirga tractuosa]|nr:hypothetical protein [Marivirga tractuosa]BDD15137.1 hypothetical protein MATR_19620 [Marivirga tractuosa]